MLIEIYSDGASTPQTTKVAGWAFTVKPIGDSTKWVIYYGYLTPPSTNNIAEMYGVLNSMKLLYSFSHGGQRKIPDAVIYSDSQYVINGMLQYRVKWETQGYPEINRNIWEDLFETYDNLKKVCRLQLVWVRGHAGTEGNVIADEWAVKAKNDNMLDCDSAYRKSIKVNGDFNDFLYNKTAVK